MKVGDIVKVNLGEQGALFWEVVGVFLGGENVDGVVELVPINKRCSGQGRTFCPAMLLEAAYRSPAIEFYTKVVS